jgi:hypothetical protein
MYALTVGQSQGHSLPLIVVHGCQMWQHSALYVALSRSSTGGLGALLKYADFSQLLNFSRHVWPPALQRAQAAERAGGGGSQEPQRELVCDSPAAQVHLVSMLAAAPGAGPLPPGLALPAAVHVTGRRVPGAAPGSAAALAVSIPQGGVTAVAIGNEPPLTAAVVRAELTPVARATTLAAAASAAIDAAGQAEEAEEAAAATAATAAMAAAAAAAPSSDSGARDGGATPSRRSSGAGSSGRRSRNELTSDDEDLGGDAGDSAPKRPRLATGSPDDRDTDGVEQQRLLSPSL